ncbi:hypothetical protein [Streptomyces platensis]|uniref:hypothetical protein n=1 Tax=Streptomyces platensis TaxID=58346 RepID=UPI003796EE84
MQKHEFKNLIALCPTCHARFDDPHSPIDRKAMRQYKANLNPLLSGDLVNREGHAALLAAYQELRGRFSEWVSAETRHAVAKSRKSTSVEIIEELRLLSADKFAWALGAVADFQSAWEQSDASGLIGAIFYHVADWSDEVHAAPYPIPGELVNRDISEEISEASAELHLMVWEGLSI